MTREEVLMQMIKLKYKSLRNFSIKTGIPNSTLNSMFKKGLGGTAVDTVLKVCSVLGCDIYSLDDSSFPSEIDDRAFFSDYLKLDPSSKQLVKIVTAHQLSCSQGTNVLKPAAKKIVFPAEKAVSLRTIRVYTSAASAGFGEYLENSDYDDVAVSDDVPTQADFGIYIHGDSMMPEINDGDVVWIRQQESIEENQIAVFVLNGDALCKKLVSRNHRLFLHSLNKKYNDIPITEYDSLKVIGRVIGSSAFPY